MGPIKNLSDIQFIKNNLKKNKRNYFLFLLAINTPLKTKELLNLKINDFKLNENKLTINKEISTCSKELLDAFNSYIKEKNLKFFHYISCSDPEKNKPIDRSHWYRILKNSTKDLHLEITPECLRKTYGYHYYNDYEQDTQLLKKEFNKRTEKELFLYLGITKKNKNNFKL